MEQWFKIAENLAHKRAGVILAAIAAVAFAGLEMASNIIIMAGATVYTMFQTASDRDNNEEGKDE